MSADDAMAGAARATRHPPLPSDEVHVWRASLDLDDALVREAEEVIDRDEWGRAERFLQDLQRRRYVVGRAALRALIGRYLGIAPRDVALVYGEHGKPRLASEGGGAHPLRFNLSHCGGVALLAFALGREVGVDVERPRTGLDAEGIAERFFSRRESAELRALPAAERAGAFASGWTRKEAYLKGLGSGLARPLAGFSVSLGAHDPVPLEDDAAEGWGWEIRSLAPGEGYAAALAVERGRGVRVRWLEWEPRGGFGP